MENYSESSAIIYEDKLPDHPNHPKGRNPYAHVALCIKEKFYSSYKDIPDEKFNDVIDFIEFLKKSKMIYCFGK